MPHPTIVYRSLRSIDNDNRVKGLVKSSHIIVNLIHLIATDGVEAVDKLVVVFNLVNIEGEYHGDWREGSN
jgi:hypothetical protein